MRNHLFVKYLETVGSYMQLFLKDVRMFSVRPTFKELQTRTFHLVLIFASQKITMSEIVEQNAVVVLKPDCTNALTQKLDFAIQ